MELFVISSRATLLIILVTNFPKTFQAGHLGALPGHSALSAMLVLPGLRVPSVAPEPLNPFALDP